MLNLLYYALIMLLGYIIGSLNFAIIYSKLRKDDIRRHGSRNAGATNILRTYGKLPALLVFLLDISKGIIAVLLVRFAFNANELMECVAALGAIIGHNYPLFYHFRGGKGVSTSFAVLLILHWEVALISLFVFIITVLVSRYVSLSSILASIAAIICSFLIYSASVFSYFCLVIGLLCIIRHKRNIIRLLSGKERRLGYRG